jgi:hypothetical protein
MDEVDAARVVAARPLTEATIPAAVSAMLTGPGTDRQAG